jgi:hypothetical protein
MSQRIPYLRGNTLHEDYTHWRTGELGNLSSDSIWEGEGVEVPTAGLQPALPYYPVGFTIDEMMQLSWRIKTWTLAGSYTNDLSYVPGGGTGTGTFTATVNSNILLGPMWINNPNQDGSSVQFPPLFAANTQASEENQLMAFANPTLEEWTLPPSFPTQVIPPTYSSADLLVQTMGCNGLGLNINNNSPVNITDTISGGTPPFVDYFKAPNLGQITMLLYFMGQQPIGKNNGRPQDQVFFDPSTKLFYPFFYFMVQCFSERIINRLLYIRIESRNITGSDPTAGSMSILGHTIPLYLTNTTAHQIDLTSQLASNYACTMTLTPKEYWPYSTSTGQPVYDTVTGAQLNDPFN